jgi:hypothetical protein
MTLTELYAQIANPSRNVSNDVIYNNLMMLLRYHVYYLAGGKKDSSAVNKLKKEDKNFVEMSDAILDVLRYVYNYAEFICEYTRTGYGTVGCLFKRLNKDKIFCLKVTNNTSMGYDVTVYRTYPVSETRTTVLNDKNYINFFKEELMIVISGGMARKLHAMELREISTTFDLLVSELTERKII